MKVYKEEDVYEAALGRIKWVFDNFEYVYVSFSGGKDSGVLLNLTLDYMLQHNIKKRLGVFHIDYEAQYQLTTEYVEETFASLPDFCDKYWCCMPVSAQCSTSMYQHHWIPWDKNKKHIWVRDLPKGCINIHNHDFDFFVEGMEDYEFQKQFGDWLAKKIGKKTACLVGIRSDESYSRHVMIASRRNRRKFTDILWSTGGASKDQYNFYPIYDWKSKDIWIYNSKFNKSYNRLYDLYYQAGLSIDKMRVASPFNNCGTNALKLYKVLDPHMWGKMVSRVNGVSFTSIYGGTTAMGWKGITKPNHFTWKQYLEFLLTTLPEEIREKYLKKFKVSIKFWQNKGGVLSNRTIEELSKNNSVKFEVLTETNYKTDKKPVRFEEYPDELNVTDFKAVPSYKRMCICIMKNDLLCTYMGFTLTKEEKQRRKTAMERYNAL